MLNEHRGALCVKFKDSAAGSPIVVGELDEPLEAASTVIIGSPDGFKGVELSFHQHWLNEEENSQDPSFIWERLSKPQTRTVNAVSTVQGAIDEVIYLEKRCREYCVQQNILLQVKRLQKAAEN